MFTAAGDCSFSADAAATLREIGAAAAVFHGCFDVHKQANHLGGPRLLILFGDEPEFAQVMGIAQRVGAISVAVCAGQELDEDVEAIGISLPPQKQIPHCKKAYPPLIDPS